MDDEKSPTAGLWYWLGGVAAGAALGVLFAPKKGSELRKDLGDWGREGREKSRALIAKLGARIPHKAANENGVEIK